MNLKERYSQLSNKTKRTLLEDRELAYMEFRKIYEDTWDMYYADRRDEQ